MLHRDPIVSSLLAGAVVFCLSLANPVGTAHAGEGAFAPWKNGQSPDKGFFPIAVWLQSPQNAGRYQKIGINLYVGLYQGPTQAQMDTLRQFNMPVICHQNEWARQHLGEELMVAWMHGDEPDNAHRFATYWQGDKDRIKAGWPEIYEDLDLDTKPYRGYGPPVPPQWVINDYQDIKRVDPIRPVLVNLGQGVAWEGYIGRGERTGKLEDYPVYIRGCDIVSFDIYPACHSKPAVAQKLWYVPQGVDRLRQWAGPSKPVWTCIETTQINHPTTKATPEQIKCEVWMAIIHGAKGLIYFAHTWKPRFIEAGLLADAHTAQAVKNINAQVTALASVINGPSIAPETRVRTVPRGGQVDIMVKKAQGAIYVFAVDMQGKATRASIQIQDVGNARAEVLGEARTISIRGGRLTDDFDAWGVHLYRIK
jgi:hypothetical protein